MPGRKTVTKEQVNAVLKNASETSLKNILGFSDEPLVSHDYVGDPRSGIVDSICTDVLEDHMIKILSWYDNEWGYSSRIAQLTEFYSNKTSVMKTIRDIDIHTL